jgi:hypothetical protein
MVDVPSRLVDAAIKAGTAERLLAEHLGRQSAPTVIVAAFR